MDERAALIEEEKLGCDTPLGARIHTVPSPLATDREIEVEAERVYTEGRGLFKNLKEAEYFSMLPLSKQERLAVIRRTLEIQQEDADAKAAWSQSESKK
jgi:hypothetical protein